MLLLFFVIVSIYEMGMYVMKNSNHKRKGSVKDSAAKQYFRKKEVFADLCSAYLFQQPGRVSPSSLVEIPTEYNELLDKAGGGYSPLMLERDLAFQAYTDGDRGYALLCAEFQSTQDITMPVRVMKYDSLSYAYQLRERLCEQAGRLMPVSTIVVNLGREAWRGPTSLYQMFPQVDGFVSRFVPDYAINLFDPYALDEKTREMLCTDFRNVVNLFRSSRNKDMLLEMYPKGGTAYLSREGVNLVNVCLDLELEEPEEGGQLEMCKAVQDLKASERRAGRREGRREGIEEVATNAIRRGMQHSEVSAITGLSLARISQLASEIGLGCKS